MESFRWNFIKNFKNLVKDIATLKSAFHRKIVELVFNCHQKLIISNFNLTQYMFIPIINPGISLNPSTL